MPTSCACSRRAPSRFVRLRVRLLLPELLLVVRNRRDGCDECDAWRAAVGGGRGTGPSAAFTMGVGCARPVAANASERRRARCARSVSRSPPARPLTCTALLLMFAKLSRCREAQRWTAAFDAGTDGSDGAAAAALCRRTVALHLSRSAKVRQADAVECARVWPCSLACVLTVSLRMCGCVCM
jgi:hypothetical protein